MTVTLLRQLRGGVEYSMLQLIDMVVVVRCSWILSRGGELQRFTDADRDQLVSNVIECMASDGLRTICLAYKNFVTSMQTIATCLI